MSFSLIKSKNEIHSQSPCVTMRLFPNPSASRQTQEGYTHFHFSALVEPPEKKRKKRWDSLPLCCRFLLEICSPFFSRPSSWQKHLCPMRRKQTQFGSLLGPHQALSIKYYTVRFTPILLFVTLSSLPSSLSGFLLPLPTLHQDNRLRANNELLSKIGLIKKIMAF